MNPIKQITAEAERFALKLTNKIRSRGWAGCVSICGMGADGTFKYTGGGTGLYVQMDIISAAAVLANGLARFKRERPGDYDGLVGLVRRELDGTDVLADFDEQRERDEKAPRPAIHASDCESDSYNDDPHMCTCPAYNAPDVGRSDA